MLLVTHRSWTQGCQRPCCAPGGTYLSPLASPANVLRLKGWMKNGWYVMTWLQNGLVLCLFLYDKMSVLLSQNYLYNKVQNWQEPLQMVHDKWTYSYGTKPAWGQGPFLPPLLLNQIVRTLVLCHLDYCSVVWASASKRLLSWKLCKIRQLAWSWAVQCCWYACLSKLVKCREKTIKQLRCFGGIFFYSYANSEIQIYFWGNNLQLS